MPAPSKQDSRYYPVPLPPAATDVVRFRILSFIDPSSHSRGPTYLVSTLRVPLLTPPKIGRLFPQPPSITERGAYSIWLPPLTKKGKSIESDRKPKDFLRRLYPPLSTPHIRRKVLWGLAVFISAILTKCYHSVSSITQKCHIRKRYV